MEFKITLCVRMADDGRLCTQEVFLFAVLSNVRRMNAGFLIVN